jgi:pimeloyl-ACP methyl ester carboxylesterase
MKGVAAFPGPGSTVERVPGVGHFMLAERPAEINARILRFLGNA